MIQIQRNPSKMERVSRTIGFLFGYFVFTTVLYFVAGRKLEWQYWHFMGVTFFVMVSGRMLKAALTS